MKRALLVVLLACGGGSKTADKPTTQQQQPAQKSAYEDLEARIPKMLAAMDSLAKDLTAVKDDCPKIAAVLRKWGSQYAVELDALWELRGKLTPAEKERYEHEHDDDAKRLEPVFAASMASCQGNAEVEDALTVAGFRRVESLKQ
ncbi:MAG: hypothetical protein M4D80_25970 [Myxococcota bacterium]|nr:hypothetical protein [Myxococcota bacterium]